MTYFASHPLRRDSSLLVTHRRAVEVQVPATRLGEILRGASEVPADLDDKTRTLLQSLQRTLRAAPPPEVAVVDSLTIAVDEQLAEVVPVEVLAALFAIAGLKPDFIPTTAVLDLEPGVNRALITLTTTFDVARMFAWESHARASDLFWAPLHLTTRGVAYGPYVEPSDDGGQCRSAAVRSPGPRDLVARWITAASDPDQVRARLNPATFTFSRHRLHDLLPSLATFAADVEQWLLARPAAGLWHHVVHTGERRTTHPVLPLPLAAHPAYDGEGDPPAHLTPDDVLDPVTGIVVGVRPINLSETFPRGAVYMESQTADMGRVRPWAANIYNAGSAWDDVDAARYGAIGEAIERYCGNVYPPEHLRRCSYNQLLSDGEHAVDPRDLVLFSERQYAQPGMPFVPLDPDLECSWVPGRSLVTGQLTWVPASLVYVNWNSGDSILDPPVDPAYYPGIAAAPTRAAALRNALEEVVERDASMIWWLSGATVPTLPQPAFLKQRAKPGSPVTMNFVSLPNRFSLPVIAAIADDASDGVCTVGFACRHTPELAAQKALLEALGLLESARDMQRPDGGFWRAYVDAGTPDQPIKDIRADRRYLDEYRPDFRDVTDLFCQLQVQLDPRAREVTTRRWDATGAAGSPTWEQLPRLPECTPRWYVDALASQGFDPICVELTTSDVRAAGWTAVRVVVPGLVPNFPTAFPPLGTGRILHEPAHLGLCDRPLSEGEIFTFPMPYA